MIAQAYYKDARIIRIFSNESPCGIADLPLDQLNNKSADESLRKIGLQRVGRWKDMYFGKQAAVRFRTSNPSHQGTTHLVRSTLDGVVQPPNPI